MKLQNETDEDFLSRFEEAKRHGECIFRDDVNREMILDIIDAYIDAKETLFKENI